MHNVLCNSKAKGFPFSTPALLSLKLPKRKGCGQPYAQVPSASTCAAPQLCLGQTPLSPALGTQVATACALAPQNTGTGRDTQRGAGELAHLCSGTSPSQHCNFTMLCWRATHKLRRSDFSLWMLWSRRHDSFGVKPQIQSSAEIRFTNTFLSALSHRNIGLPQFT